MKEVVGPKSLYDMLGFHQLKVLVDMGLREHHTVLDIGAGIFRAGRFILEYVGDENYFAVEPNKILVDYGLDRVVPHRTVNVSGTPNYDFRKVFNKTFDYVLCHAVATHLPGGDITKLLQGIKSVLHRESMALVTFGISEEIDEYTGAVWHPTIAYYKEKTVTKAVHELGMKITVLGIPHPKGQRWTMIQL